MISAMERRQGEHARIPCAISVELQPEQASGFEADAIDLSTGGLSLRATRLPEIGEQLRCSFETVPGGTRISGRGEVVWARYSGDRRGEFGLRFTRIEPEAQALIDEMIAERVARGSTPPSTSGPRMARLELAQGDGPITAKLMRAVGQEVLFEQPLELLALGRSVSAHADKDLGQGNIVRVGLRMDGGTPTLALTVRFSEAQDEYGEYTWDDQSSQSEPGGVGAAEANLAADADPWAPERTTSFPKAIEREAPRSAYERTLHGLPRLPAAAPTSNGEVAAPEYNDTTWFDPETGESSPGFSDVIEPIGRRAAPVPSRLAAMSGKLAEPEELEPISGEQPLLPQDRAPDMDTEPDVFSPARMTLPPSGVQTQPGGAESHALRAEADAFEPAEELDEELVREVEDGVEVEAASPQQAEEPLPAALRTPPPPTAADQLNLFGAGLTGRPEQRRVNAGKGAGPLADTSPGTTSDSGYATPHGFQLLDAGPDSHAHEAIPLDDPTPREATGRFDTDEGEPDDDVPADARSSALVRFLRIFAVVQLAARSASEQLTDAATKLGRKLSSDPERRVVRRKPITLRGLGIRPRRTTALPPGARDLNANRARLRLIAIIGGVAAFGALAIVVLRPESDQEDLALRDEQHLQNEALETTPDPALDPFDPANDPELAPDSPVLSAKAAVHTGAVVPEPAPRGSAKTSRLPTLRIPATPKTTRVPAVPTVPPIPPSTAAATRSGSSVFGAKNVPNAKRFTLRLSAPIRSLTGIPDPNGFNVLVDGARSLDRAAPIRASHKAVEHASILNRGDSAELKIRFLPGKRPAYRVSAQGEQLEILIAK